ncbi:hypothetical protein ACJRO7_008504 [Eucalyptus globulus]|uniref:Uncharacterized protein n=1 Tax=Eucalyptus globulus TaxID=34317 RepID=A0ABD3IRH2_EUCGL
MHNPNPDLCDPRSSESGEGGPDLMSKDVIIFVDDEARSAFKNEPDKYNKFFAAFLEANRFVYIPVPLILPRIEEILSKVAESLEEKPQLFKRWKDDIGPKLRTIMQHAAAKAILERNRELWATKFADIVKRRCKDEVKDRFLCVFCCYQNESITFEEFEDETKKLFHDDSLILETFRSFVANPHGDHG